MSQSIIFDEKERAAMTPARLGAEIERDARLWDESGEMPVKTIKTVILITEDVWRITAQDDSAPTDENGRGYQIDFDNTPERCTPRPPLYPEEVV